MLHRIKVFLFGEKAPNYLEAATTNLEMKLALSKDHAENAKTLQELKSIAEIEKLRAEAVPRVEKRPFISGDTILKCVFAAGMAYVGYNLEKDGRILPKQFGFGPGPGNLLKL